MFAGDLMAGAAMFVVCAAAAMSAETSEEHSFELRVVEIDCSLAIEEIELCESFQQFTAVQAADLLALADSPDPAFSQSSCVVSTPAKNNIKHMRKVLGGTASIRLHWSPLDTGALLTSISVRMTQPNEDANDIETEAVMAPGETPIILGGISRGQDCMGATGDECPLLRFTLLHQID